jgi:hypothetical protein
MHQHKINWGLRLGAIAFSICLPANAAFAQNNGLCNPSSSYAIWNIFGVDPYQRTFAATKPFYPSLTPAWNSEPPLGGLAAIDPNSSSLVENDQFSLPGEPDDTAPSSSDVEIEPTRSDQPTPADSTDLDTITRKELTEIRQQLAEALTRSRQAEARATALEQRAKAEQAAAEKRIAELKQTIPKVEPSGPIAFERFTKPELGTQTKEN